MTLPTGMDGPFVVIALENKTEICITHYMYET